MPEGQVFVWKGKREADFHGYLGRTSDEDWVEQEKLRMRAAQWTKDW